MIKFRDNTVHVCWHEAVIYYENGRVDKKKFLENDYINKDAGLLAAKKWITERLGKNTINSYEIGNNYAGFFDFDLQGK